MTRVKRGNKLRKRHNKVLKHAKGFRGNRSRTFRIANETVRRAWVYSFRDRKVKKREFRRLWITRINSAVKSFGLSYSKFIHGLQLAKISINRKVLAEIAVNNPIEFEKLVNIVKESL